MSHSVQVDPNAVIRELGVKIADLTCENATLQVAVGTLLEDNQRQATELVSTKAEFEVIKRELAELTAALEEDD
jgi:hypothetical protein